jgi:hypothetical protein
MVSFYDRQMVDLQEQRLGKQDIFKHPDKPTDKLRFRELIAAFP